jgi:hypothetical protein
MMDWAQFWFLAGMVYEAGGKSRNMCFCLVMACINLANKYFG